MCPDTKKQHQRDPISLDEEKKSSALIWKAQDPNRSWAERLIT